jgi:alpha(1,3/1,4) fucosyltransferase
MEGSTMTRPIRIAFIDFPGDGTPHAIIDLLTSRFDIQVTDENPDFVIYSVFGHRFLDHPDAIRIFITSENVRPDFNLCDYAFGFDWLEYDDRYYRAPNYAFFPHFKQLCIARRSRITREELASTRTRFCNFIYTNGQAHPYRDQLFHALSKYKTVDSAGRHLNNTGFNPGKAHSYGWADEKVEFQSRYKFSIACENDTFPGYTTEKIVHALAAGSIPIYFGNPLVAREFNAMRIINGHDHDSIDSVVQRVVELDRDDDAYLKVVAEPFFPDDRVPTELTLDALAERFVAIFAQPKGLARRRGSYYWSQIYEHKRRHEASAAELLTDVIPLLAQARRIAPASLAGQIQTVQDRLTAHPPPDGDPNAARWRMRIAMAELSGLVREDDRVVLVDQNEWENAKIGLPFRTVPFLERDGEYWGPPADDAVAIAELERLRIAGATHFVLASPAFWWIEHYRGFIERVRASYRPVLQNDRLMVFDLNATPPNRRNS